MDFHLSKIARTIIRRKTPFEKMIGLMFKSKSFIEENAMLFLFNREQKIPLHMFFVFFPIDIVWLNSEHEIIDMKKKAKPFTPQIYHRGKVKFVIEFSSGTLDKFGIKLMDKIHFKE